jgi:hypothetical protein
MPESNNFYEIRKYYPIITRTEYQISRLIDVLYCTIYILAHNQKTICKCKCCNKYFIPKNRNDTLNCSKKCADENKKEALSKNYTEISKIYCRIVNYLNRHKKSNMLNTFTKRYTSKKEELSEKYTDKNKYIEKLTEWLIIYENKHIKKK